MTITLRPLDWMQQLLNWYNTSSELTIYLTIIPIAFIPIFLLSFFKKTEFSTRVIGSFGIAMTWPAILTLAVIIIPAIISHYIMYKMTKLVGFHNKTYAEFSE